MMKKLFHRKFSINVQHLIFFSCLVLMWHNTRCSCSTTGNLLRPSGSALKLPFVALEGATRKPPMATERKKTMLEIFMVLGGVDVLKRNTNKTYEYCAWLCLLQSKLAALQEAGEHSNGPRLLWYGCTNTQGTRKKTIFHHRGLKILTFNFRGCGWFDEFEILQIICCC
jgi:hypothetical protein